MASSLVKKAPVTYTINGKSATKAQYDNFSTTKTVTSVGNKVVSTDPIGSAGSPVTYAPLVAPTSSTYSPIVAPDVSKQVSSIMNVTPSASDIKSDPFNPTGFGTGIEGKSQIFLDKKTPASVIAQTTQAQSLVKDTQFTEMYPNTVVGRVTEAIMNPFENTQAPGAVGGIAGAGMIGVPGASAGSAVTSILSKVTGALKVAAPVAGAVAIMDILSGGISKEEAISAAGGAYGGAKVGGTAGAITGAAAGIILNEPGKEENNMGLWDTLDQAVGGYLPGGVTPTQDKAVEGLGVRIVKQWSTGTATFALLSDGRQMVQRKNGTIKVYRPYRPISFGKNVDFSKLYRVWKKHKKAAKHMAAMGLIKRMASSASPFKRCRK